MAKNKEDELLVALADIHLTPHEGREVLRSTLTIKKTGDGLSTAMAFDPVELRHRQRFFVVLECEIVDLHYPMIPETDALIRAHVANTVSATLVDADDVEHLVAEKAAEIARIKAKLKGMGMEPLDFPEDGEGDDDSDLTDD